MSRTKAVVIEGHLRWIWSDTHDVVLASMIEVGAALGFVPGEWLESWRQWASVPDLAFATAEAPTSESRDLLRKVLLLTRDLVVQRGDVTQEQLQRWSMAQGLEVAEGRLRTGRVTAGQMLEVIDEFLDLLGHPRRLFGAPH